MVDTLRLDIPHNHVCRPAVSGGCLDPFGVVLFRPEAVEHLPGSLQLLGDAGRLVAPCTRVVGKRLNDVQHHDRRRVERRQGVVEGVFGLF